jgi:hypothetical protein
VKSKVLGRRRITLVVEQRNVVKRLIEILREALNGSLEDGWLFLQRIDGDWYADSEGVLIDIDSLPEEEMDGDDPVAAKQRDLRETLDSQTIQDIAEGAAAIEDPLSDDTLVEAFNYYFKYDAFLPEKGFVPLPREEWQRKFDLDFYNKLGEESVETVCKKQDCNRGTVECSVFCRVHHFEMIQKQPCPFTD